jgi:hypothetical protein
VFPHGPHHLLCHLLQHSPLVVELLDRRDQGDHDLGLNIDSASHRADGCLEDRSPLHLGDLGIRDAESAAAVSEHGVRLTERFHDPRKLVSGQFESSRKQLALLAPVRQEFMQRRVEQPDGHRQSAHRLEDALEVAALHGKELREGTTAPSLFPSDDHLAHRRDPVTLEEHMLGATQTYPFGSEAARNPRIARRIGIRANLEGPHLIGPAEEPGE